MTGSVLIADDEPLARRTLRQCLLDLKWAGPIHEAPDGVRAIRAQAVVRGARPQAMAFEFVDMDLEERARLRKLLLEFGGLPMAAQATNRTKRRGRVAMLKN